MPTVDAVREAHYLDEVKRLVLKALEGRACQAFLFGSRVSGLIKRSSDFDIGISGLSRHEFETVKRRIEDTIEESLVPHGIDVVNFDEADDSFQRVARREVSVWKSA